MFKWVIHKIQQHKRFRQGKKFQRGYSYAAFQLLSKRMSVAGLESYIDSAMIFGYHDEFDRGIRAAIRDWERLVRMQQP